MKLHAEQRNQIWENVIRQDEFSASDPSTSPKTILLGAQAGAGKTKAVMRLQTLYPDDDLVYIDPDELRMYHPDYSRLIAETPLRMPKQTGRASEDWTNKCVNFANEHGYSIELESTWGNFERQLAIMQAAKQHGRTVHVVALATPPLISSSSTLGRYYKNFTNGGDPRWVSPETHDMMVDRLPESVKALSMSTLPDEFITLSRDGILYRGDNGGNFFNAWQIEFTRPLSHGELVELKSYVDQIQQIKDKYEPGNEEAQSALDELKMTTAFINVPKTPIGKAPQPRRPNGEYDFNR